MKDVLAFFFFLDCSVLFDACRFAMGSTQLCRTDKWKLRCTDDRCACMHDRGIVIVDAIINVEDRIRTMGT